MTNGRKDVGRSMQVAIHRAQRPTVKLVFEKWTASAAADTNLSVLVYLLETLLDLRHRVGFLVTHSGKE